ncbi:hypothetical protein NDU88_000039 [Pleurodeles waltl]|uniref:Uncharacterized protein n=1 Tax=Pleurodeles waltl TaxID=8319 RepID=A0AAV7U2E5_PLEWA|nr:hypothetical protein NDU88_000039 [Pleurodeles waltl]
MRPYRDLEMILEVEAAGGQCVSDSLGVINKFRDHYEDLYISKSVHNDPDITDCLEHITMTRLTNDDRERLMSSLKPTEIRKVIQEMAAGKAPGMDGLPVTVYKRYQEILIPQLQTLFQGIAAYAIMPPTMREALMVTLLKPSNTLRHCF